MAGMLLALSDAYRAGPGPPTPGPALMGMTEAPATPAELARRAWHESGHSTAGYLTGQEVGPVTIRPDEDSGGHATIVQRDARSVAIPGEKPFGWPFRGFDPASRAKAETVLLTLMAGRAAEHVYGPHGAGSSWRGYAELTDARSSDPARVNEIAFQIAGSAANALIDYAYAVALEMVRRPLFAACCSTLAAALLEHETLTGAQARKLLQTAERRHNQEMTHE
jgi:hypothetical protein